MPMPASHKWMTSNDETALAHGKRTLSSIAGKYIHPDCGSPAKGTPPITSGFQPGTVPSRKLSPRKQ